MLAQDPATLIDEQVHRVLEGLESGLAPAVQRRMPIPGHEGRRRGRAVPGGHGTGHDDDQVDTPGPHGRGRSRLLGGLQLEHRLRGLIGRPVGQRLPRVVRREPALSARHGATRATA